MQPAAHIAEYRDLRVDFERAQKTLQPLLGKFTADRLSVRAADSLLVGTSKTTNTFSVTPQEQEGGRIVPYLRLESDNSRLFFKNPSALVGAKDAWLTAAAQMK